MEGLYILRKVVSNAISVTDELLQNNAAYAQSFDNGEGERARLHLRG